MLSMVKVNKRSFKYKTFHKSHIHTHMGFYLVCVCVYGVGGQVGGGGGGGGGSSYFCIVPPPPPPPFPPQGPKFGIVHCKS